jgi:hypothetical protein
MFNINAHDEREYPKNSEMGFLQRLIRTFACLIAGWLAASLILVTVVVAFGVSIHDALAWPYETGKVTLACWVLFGIPLAALDQRRSWLPKWWLASLFGGILGVVSFAAYMYWFFRVTSSGLALYPIAFVIGSVTLGLYYRSRSEPQ